MKEQKKRKKKKSRWKISDIIILTVAVLILLVSLWKLTEIFLEYKEGTDTYAKLEGLYIERGDVAIRQEETGEETAAAEESVFPQLAVDFEALKEINGEFFGWFYLPVLEINYPLVQGADNDYYLTHTFDKKKNSSGAIFMDYGASPDLTDYNTFIYGHNMKNGSMFGKLKNFIRDEELCAQDPYFYIYTEEKWYQYLIVSYYVTWDGSEAYSLPANGPEYKTYRGWILSSTPYECPEEIPDGAPIVTLSTCYGKSGSDQRFVVHGILKEVQDMTE